jgi:hypothetical protein
VENLKKIIESRLLQQLQHIIASPAAYCNKLAGYQQKMQHIK